MHILVLLFPVLQVQNYMLYQDIECCFLFLFLLPVLGLDDDDVLLVTMLSTTSVTNLISWLLADDITADSGMPFLSVKMCLFVPSLLLSVGLLPVIAPPRATLSIFCQQ